MKRSLALGLFVLLSVACGSKEPAPATPASPAPTASATAEAPAASAEPAPAEPKKRRPYEVFNACNDVSTIVFGDPKAGSGGKRTIASGSSIEGVRDADGNQTVWLLDTNGEPLVKVNVTRGMRRVEIGKSCRTLDAR